MFSMLCTQTPQTTAHGGFSSLQNPRPFLHTRCIQIPEWFWFSFHSCNRSGCLLFHAFHFVHCTIYFHLVLKENLVLYYQAKSCFHVRKNSNINTELQSYKFVHLYICTIVLEQEWWFTGEFVYLAPLGLRV